MKLAPFRLAPIFVPRIWGSRDLQPLFDLSKEKSRAPAQDAEPIGEVWFTGEDCQVASGPLEGRSLGEVWRGLPEASTGALAIGMPRIPLLVKFIFPEDKLSVQVHPDDDYARQHEAAAGGVGKTEMWYAVSARAGAEVRLGLEQGVTRESFRQATADGTVENFLRRHEVRAGEAFFIPAGTAHMIGPGMVLCEVQEHSDLTYRVFDYNRLQPDGKPRQLHTQQALDVMNFGNQSGGLVETVHVQHGALSATYLAACRHFVVEKLEFAEQSSAATSTDSFELLIVLAGTGRVESGSESFSYAPAQVWFLPANLGNYRIAPESKSGAAQTVLLRTFVPDVDKLAHTLASDGVADAAVSRLVHR